MAQMRNTIFDANPFIVLYQQYTKYNHKDILGTNLGVLPTGFSVSSVWLWIDNIGKMSRSFSYSISRNDPYTVLMEVGCADRHNK